MSGPPVPFIKYVGEPDFHDGTIVQVRTISNGTVRVSIRGASGSEYSLDFQGVSSCQAVSPEGMFIYAISEMQDNPPLRKFVFVNSDENNGCSLEIVATGFTLARIPTEEL